MGKEAMRKDIGDAVNSALDNLSRSQSGSWIAKVHRSSDTNIQVTTRGGGMFNVVVGKFKR